MKPAASEVIAERQETVANGETLLLGRRAKATAPGHMAGSAEGQPGDGSHSDRAPRWCGVGESVSQSAGGLVKGILDRGGAVLGIDAFQTGAAKAPRDRNKRAFTVYNQTDDANRVQDILTALTYLQSRSNAKVVNLAGLEMAGVWSTLRGRWRGRG